MDTQYYKQYEPIFGSWRITRLIGEGSFGKVFEIEREDFGVTYKAALKAITVPASQAELLDVKADGLDDASVRNYFGSFVQDLVKEFALMSKLKGNSNVVSYENHQVIEHKQDIGWDILIQMELLTPLNQYTSTHTVTRQDVIRLGIDLCKALELCQKYNIIHRDVKPENIFISENGDFKLGDFGIARTVEKTTSGLSKKGTYTYMAPEVYKGEAYGSTVDIYSLGIVLYRLLNGNRTPFLPAAPAPITHADRENALAKRFSGAPLPAPSHATGRLAEIVLKACAYDPRDRYSSPRQMRQELEAILYSREERQYIYPEGDEVPQDSIHYIKTGEEPPVAAWEATRRDVTAGGRGPDTERSAGNTVETEEDLEGMAGGPEGTVSDFGRTVSDFGRMSGGGSKGANGADQTVSDFGNPAGISGGASRAAGQPAGGSGSGSGPAPQTPPPAAPGSGKPGKKKTGLFLGLAAGLVILCLAGVFLLGGGDKEGKVSTVSSGGAAGNRGETEGGEKAESGGTGEPAQQEESSYRIAVVELYDEEFCAVMEAEWEKLADSRGVEIVWDMFERPGSWEENQEALWEQLREQIDDGDYDAVVSTSVLADDFVVEHFAGQMPVVCASVFYPEADYYGLQYSQQKGVTAIPEQVDVDVLVDAMLQVNPQLSCVGLLIEPNSTYSITIYPSMKKSLEERGIGYEEYLLEDTDGDSIPDDASYIEQVSNMEGSVDAVFSALVSSPPQEAVYFLRDAGIPLYSFSDLAYHSDNETAVLVLACPDWEEQGIRAARAVLENLEGETVTQYDSAVTELYYNQELAEQMGLDESQLSGMIPWTP